MNKASPLSTALQRLRAAGLRPTRQRLALARLLLESGDRHVTAEHLHGEAMATGIKVSLATVYNTLHQFT
jgi:Fur family iron response transcriptional regulator